MQYTWWTVVTNARARNIGWRLDYYLISAALAGQAVEVTTHVDVYGSDHCPVTLVMKDAGLP